MMNNVKRVHGVRATRNLNGLHGVHIARRALSILASAALLTSLAACGNQKSSSSSATTSSNQTSATNKADDKNLTPMSFMLDWTPNTNHVGVYVAQKLGYYQQAGLKLTILPTAQTGAETAVESGVANVGFTTLSNVAAVNASGSHLHFIYDLTQKQVARWCSLKSRKDITSPKDFSGKTFVTFGSAEQTAVLKQMIRHDGGKPDFKTVTVGTSTFQTLTSGKGDFGGFYETWEGVQSRLDGPALNCFIAGDYGVPGNPDQLGFAVSSTWEKAHSKQLKAFVKATARGYQYALKNPDKAASILLEATRSSALDPKLTKASMKDIVAGKYWGDASGKTDVTAAQQYINFLADNNVYRGIAQDAKVKDVDAAARPQASTLATNDYVA